MTAICSAAVNLIFIPFFLMLAPSPNDSLSIVVLATVKFMITAVAVISSVCAIWNVRCGYARGEIFAKEVRNFLNEQFGVGKPWAAASEKHLKAIENQRSEIERLLAVSETRSEEGEALTEALTFLEQQQTVIQARAIIEEWLVWEPEALETYRRIIAADWRRTDFNLEETKVAVREAVGNAQLTLESWQSLRLERIREADGEIRPRLTKLIELFEILSKRLHTEQVVKALSGINQVEDGQLMLPEAHSLEAATIFSELQAMSGRELAFQHLRIKSLKEISLSK